MFFWTKTYYGQSPGDLENKKNGFAGRFGSFNKNITSPHQKFDTNLPTILIVGDSIIGENCILNIIQQFKGIANVNFLQQPHHCKNINSWLDKWLIDEWNHYHCIFWFDGMHGFPSRVTEDEYKILTPKLVNRIKNSTKNILWGNCTPIPDKFPQHKTNSVKGPNSKEQILTNESVINRNKSIKEVMTKLNIEVLDLYEKTSPNHSQIQKALNDCHFNKKGEIIISNYICETLKKLFF